MRYTLYRLVTRTTKHDQFNRVYNLFMMAAACLSMVPLMFKAQQPWMLKLDLLTVYILFVDFVLHWITADYELKKYGKWAFFLYAVSPVALLNFISLLPSLGLLPDSLRILRLFRLLVVLRYSKNFSYISNVFKRERRTLLTVLFIALGYIFVTALIMFVADPDTFPSFFDSLYWATTALTTVGYGDIYPHNELGRLVSMISSLFGIAVIALPAGVVTAGFMQELDDAKRKLESEAALEEREMEDTQSELKRLKLRLAQYEASEPKNIQEGEGAAPHA